MTITLLATIAVCLSLALLSGCDSPSDAEAIAARLRQHYHDRPLNYGWMLAGIDVPSPHEIVVNVQIDGEGLTDSKGLAESKAMAEQIRLRNRMDQMAIARIACPNTESAQFGPLPQEVRLFIALKNQRGEFIRAQCK